MVSEHVGHPFLLSRPLVHPLGIVEVAERTIAGDALRYELSMAMREIVLSLHVAAELRRV